MTQGTLVARSISERSLLAAQEGTPGTCASQTHATHLEAKRTSIIIPVYNEEQALPHVLEHVVTIIDESYEIIVVDDGSTDNTCAVAAQFPCRIISHSVNRGKGAAMLTGFEHARGEHIIVIDGDATYPADAIPHITMQLHHYDMVRCVRSEGRTNIPWFNQVGNQIFDGLISAIHRVEGTDMLSGLYGLRRTHLLAMRLASQGFDIETEILVKARAMELTSVKIPIRYNERIGEKKLNALRDGLRILKRILSLATVLNPFATYVLPGLVLWGIGALAVTLLVGGPVRTPFASLSIHTLIVAAMSFLAGFQLVVFGCVVNLYASASGLGRPNSILGRLMARTPRLGGAALGTLMLVIGTVWSLVLTASWVSSGMGLFVQTEALVIALALVVWGIQLLSTVLFLSLFAGPHRYTVTPASSGSSAVRQEGLYAPEPGGLERAVGEA